MSTDLRRQEACASETISKAQASGLGHVGKLGKRGTKEFLPTCRFSALLTVASVFSPAVSLCSFTADIGKQEAQAAFLLVPI